MSPYVSRCYLRLLRREWELMQQSAAKLASTHTILFAPQASGSVPDGANVDLHI